MVLFLRPPSLRPPLGCTGWSALSPRITASTSHQARTRSLFANYRVFRGVIGAFYCGQTPTNCDALARLHFRISFVRNWKARVKSATGSHGTTAFGAHQNAEISN